LGEAPTQVETVINHRVVNRIHVIAGVSGGVRVDPAKLVARRAIETDRYGALNTRRSDAATPESLATDAWWWD
jgi:hypothetical protein